MCDKTGTVCRIGDEDVAYHCAWSNNGALLVAVVHIHTFNKLQWDGSVVPVKDNIVVAIENREFHHAA